MDQNPPTAVMWHRRDFRIRDNTALGHVFDNGHQVVPIYVLDIDCIEQAGDRRSAFMVESLRHLRSEYRSKGSDLIILSGDPADVVPDVVDQVSADSVRCNAAYSDFATSRDERVSDALDVDFHRHDDTTLVAPGDLVTKSKGTPYQKFGAYHKRWIDMDKADPYRQPVAEDMAEQDVDTVISPMDIDRPDIDLPDVDGGTQVMSDWCDGGIYSYADDRSDLCKETSRLSPYLAWGLVGIRELWTLTEQAHDRTNDTDEQESVREYQRQLCWRDFASQLLEEWPSMVSESHGDFPNGIDWRFDQDELNRWKAGMTGVPLVDAGMRQLNQEGYMHNRARMNVASFLTKNLRMHWKRGYDVFKRRLIDHTAANDAYGWQWAASTGPDGQAYWRAMSPLKQARKCDPDAEYIKKYVPELRDADPKQILDWGDLPDDARDRVAPDYPAPMVDVDKTGDLGGEMIMAGKD